MKKLLFSIVVLLVILHPKTTSVQDGRLILHSDIAQKIDAPMQVNTPADGFNLDDQVIDLVDDNINDRERKNSSFQYLAYGTFYFIGFPIYDHFFGSKWVTQNRFTIESPLFILFRVFRI
jgi:hypothetical protein